MASRYEKDGNYASENLLMTSRNEKSVEGDRTPSECSDESTERHHWGKKVEYFLAALGYCVGLGNIWRFPYVCMRNGGGAFLIPFFLSLVLCALPIYFLESAMGQFNGRSCYHVWSICPLFKGIGISMNIMTLFFFWYYAMILGWTLIYMGYSFQSTLPWTRCDQPWNSPNCITPDGKMMTALNSTSYNVSSLLSQNHTELYNSSINFLSDNSSQTMGSVLGTIVGNRNNTVASSEEFWVHQVLQRSSGLEEMGGLPYHTSLALIGGNIVVLLGVIKGIRSTGKVVYVTATLPYLLLTVMLILGMTLPGAGDGVLYYMKPDFSKLIHVHTWIDAFIQVFYSLGPGWGALITMSSYNKFHNNCMRDSIALTFCCEGTSIYGGFAIFSILGHMAHVQGVPISQFANSGAGLAFIVYPTAISYLPLPQLWGFIFFLMLFTLGLDTQFTGIETVLTTMMDLGYAWMARWRKSVSAVTMAVLTLLSLVFATRGGIYVFTLVDWYIAAFSMMSQAALECIVVGWIYGSDRFCRDIELMLGRKPYKAFVIFWKFICPVILLIVLCVTLAFFKAAKYGTYEFSDSVQVVAWFLSVIPSVAIVVVLVKELLKQKGSLKERIKAACRPDPEWCPALPSVREKYSNDLEIDNGGDCYKICCNL